MDILYRNSLRGDQMTNSNRHWKIYVTYLPVCGLGLWVGIFFINLSFAILSIQKTGLSSFFLFLIINLLAFLGFCSFIYLAVKMLKRG
jgi:uncharacterized membrane-anchored protein YitT (DUF2179 family)